LEIPHIKSVCTSYCPKYLFWTLAVVCVVLHAEVVPHLVGHGGGHQPNDVTVPHAHAPRELVGADGALQRLAHHPGVELDPRQQLPEQTNKFPLIAAQNLRASREKSGNHLRENLPTLLL
jgi:hypothetical protein